MGGAGGRGGSEGGAEYSDLQYKLYQVTAVSRRPFQSGTGTVCHHQNIQAQTSVEFFFLSNPRSAGQIRPITLFFHGPDAVRPNCSFLLQSSSVPDCSEDVNPVRPTKFFFSDHIRLCSCYATSTQVLFQFCFSDLREHGTFM